MREETAARRVPTRRTSSAQVAPESASELEGTATAAESEPVDMPEIAVAQGEAGSESDSGA